MYTYDPMKWCGVSGGVGLDGSEWSGVKWALYRATVSVCCCGQRWALAQLFSFSLLIFIDISSMGCFDKVLVCFTFV